MPITPHANGEPLLKQSSILSQFAMIPLVVWSANGDDRVLLLPRLVPIYYMMILTVTFVWVIVSPSRQIEQGADYTRKYLFTRRGKRFWRKQR